MLVSITFLTGVEVLGVGRVMWGYATLNALCMLLALRCVPETRGMTLEQIEAELMRGTPLRALGQPIRQGR